MRWMPEIKAGGGGEFEGVDACAGRDFYLEQGKSGPALTAYRAAVEIDPKNGATHLALGVGMATAGDAQNSEKELRTAAGLMPNSARPHVALGNLLSLKGQDDQAISEYQTALKLDPRNARTYVLMGMAEKKRGHADLAEKAYRQALEIDPNNVVALNNLAWIAMMNPERAGEAVGYAKKAARRGAQDGTSAGYAGMGVPQEWREWRLAGQFSEPDAEARSGKQEEQATLRKALATPFPEMNDAKTRLAANKGVS